MKWKIDLQNGLISEDEKYSILFRSKRSEIQKLLGKPDPEIRFNSEDAWYKGVKIDENLNIRIQYDESDLLLSIELMDIQIFDKSKQSNTFTLDNVDINFKEVATKSAWQALMKDLKENGLSFKRDTTRTPEGYISKDKRLFLGHDDDDKMDYIFLKRPLNENIFDKHIVTPKQGVVLAGDGTTLIFGMNKEDIHQKLNYQEQYNKGPKDNIEYYSREFADTIFGFYTIYLFFKNNRLTKVRLDDGVPIHFQNTDITLFTENFSQQELTKSFIGDYEEKFRESGFCFVKKVYTSTEEDIFDTVFTDTKYCININTARIRPDKINGITTASSANGLEEDVEPFIPKTDFQSGRILGWY